MICPLFTGGVVTDRKRARFKVIINIKFLSLACLFYYLSKNVDKTIIIKKTTF